MGDSALLTLDAGFYIRHRDGRIEPALGVPILHVVDERLRPKAILTRNLSWVGEDPGDIATAEMGMPFDGESNGGRLTALLTGGQFPRRMLADTVHDDGCYTAGALPPGKERNALRLEVDQRFRRTLLYLGESPMRAWVWYRAVRTGAWLNRRKPAQPDYKTNLVAAYDAMGLSRYLPAVTGWMAAA